MSFCSGGPTITYGASTIPNSFAAVYPQVLPSATSTDFECLPTENGFVSGVTNGIVDNTTLTNHITELLTKIKANPPTSANQNDPNAASTFATNSKKLRTSLQKEYCYYYIRYEFGLKAVLTAATGTSINDNTVIDATSGTTYSLAKTTTQAINKKLNELIQIMQKLQAIRFNSLNSGADSYYNKFNSSPADSTTFNGKLKATQQSLAQQSALLQSGSFNDDVKQSMIDYTIEKNSSSRNLLAVYGFMNIVAVGLLFYIYKASK